MKKHFWLQHFNWYFIW